MRKNVLIYGISLVALGLFLVWLNSPFKYVFKSNAELGSSKVARAQETLEEGIKKYPNNPLICFNLSKAYLLSGETKKAATVLKSEQTFNSLKTNKHFQDFLIDLSEALKDSGNVKDSDFFSNAYLALHDSNELSKRTVKNYIRVGKLLREKSLALWEKAYDTAFRIKSHELKESIKVLLLPRYIQLAEGLTSEKKYSEALILLKKSEKLGENPEIKYQIALVNAAIGNIDLASSAFEEALQLDPNNDNYKISYANVLKKAALNTRDNAKKKEYFEKIKLLLVSGDENKKKTSLLNKIINLNAKYKITNASLTIAMVGDYLYPSLTFKINPISDTVLRKYKIVFFDADKIQIDSYEAPITDELLEGKVEVTCKTPIDTNKLVNAKLFVNDEFVNEYANK